MIRRSPEAGFTLIELLVSLLISGILASVVFQLLEGNSDFVARQSAREEVQQNARASLELIAGDLRSVPASALLETEPNSIRFYLPRGWGILCNTLDTASTTAYVIFPAGTFPEEFQYGARHWGVAVEQTTAAAMSAGVYSFAPQVAQSAAGSQCDALQPNLTAEHVVRGFSVAATGLLANGGLLGAPTATIGPGTQVMVWEEIGYDVDFSETPSGNWVRRMAGYNGAGLPNMQPMAGPVPAVTSLRFTYLQEDGATPAALPDDVRQVGIWLETESRSRRRDNGAYRSLQTDTMTTDVILRNQ